MLCIVVRGRDCGMSLTIRDKHDCHKCDAFQLHAFSQYTPEKIESLLFSMNRIQPDGEVYCELAACWPEDLAVSGFGETGHGCEDNSE
jgi:hypothetical protein